MKKLFLTLMLAITGGVWTISNALVQIPSLCDTWNIMETRGIGYLSTYIQHLTTDTVISGTNYRLLEGDTIIGALREGENGKIYIVPSGHTQEYLLYDFQAQVGDTVTAWFGVALYDAVITNVSTITNGYKRLDLDAIIITVKGEKYTYPKIWIENVGNTNGPADSNCPFCKQTNVLCAYKDGEQVYASSLSQQYGCYRHTSPAYFPKGITWTYLSMPMGMDTVFYNERSTGVVETIAGTQYQPIGEYYVRYDEVNDRLYVRIDEAVAEAENLPVDLLIYDFSMNVGDSIVAQYAPRNSLYASTYWHKVVKVDTVQTSRGVLRRQTYDDGRADLKYIGASNGDFFRAIAPLGLQQEGSVCYLCLQSDGIMYYEFTPGGCSYEPSTIAPERDTIPLNWYTSDGPDGSTVDPVDPNQVVVILDGNTLTIKEHVGEELTYMLTQSTSHNAPPRQPSAQTSTFRESVSLQLSESGFYSLQLSNPHWDYTIMGSFYYIATDLPDNPTTQVSARKILLNGRLLIRQGDHLFTLTGIQIQ